MTPVTFEHRGNATVAWQKGPRHKFYEDRFRLLCHPIPVIAQANRGEIFAVLDGVGSAPKGMAAAQEVCDGLVRFFDPIDQVSDEERLLNAILTSANETIHGCAHSAPATISASRTGSFSTSRFVVVIDL